MRLITAFALFSATVMAAHPGDSKQDGYGDKGGWGKPGSEQSSYQPPAPAIQTPPAHTPPPAYEKPPAAITTPPPAQPSNYEMGVQPPPEGKKVHTVTVGGDAGLVYVPPFIQAEVGDIVHFLFLKQNHSVTQSSFAKPCNRLEGGQDSGLVPNPNNTVVPAPSWEYVVNEKEPTWWYCRQRTGNHCGKGMVFAINPTAEKTFDKFREVAIQINGTTTSAPPPVGTTPPEQPQSTVTLIAEPTPTGDVQPPPQQQPPPPPPPAAPSDKPYMAPGWNEKGNPEACNCACFCGVGAFPKGDGWGSYGGVGGSMKTPW